MTGPDDRDRYAAVEMPEWMREKAWRDIEGPARPARADRPEELAARLAEIRARAHTGALAENERRDQLNQWHHDDQATSATTAETDVYLAGYLDGLAERAPIDGPAEQEGDR